MYVIHVLWLLLSGTGFALLVNRSFKFSVITSGRHFSGPATPLLYATCLFKGLFAIFCAHFRFLLRTLMALVLIHRCSRKCALVTGYYSAVQVLLYW